MRKWILCFVAAMLLSGCAKENTNQVTEEKSQIYYAYYKSIQEMDRFIEQSSYYSIQVVMAELPDKTYRYYAILDQAQVAMYDVEMMVVESSVDYLSLQQIAPTAGIFEEKEYSLIPYQVYTEEGYMKGMVASGETTSPTTELVILVTWKDYAKLNQTREYLKVKVDYQNQTEQQKLQAEQMAMQETTPTPSPTVEAEDDQQDDGDEDATKDTN